VSLAWVSVGTVGAVEVTDERVSIVGRDIGVSVTLWWPSVIDDDDRVPLPLPIDVSAVVTAVDVFVADIVDVDSVFSTIFVDGNVLLSPIYVTVCQNINKLSNFRKVTWGPMNIINSISVALACLRGLFVKCVPPRVQNICLMRREERVDIDECVIRK
jgi:hypothetical protein